MIKQVPPHWLMSPGTEGGQRETAPDCCCKITLHHRIEDFCPSPDRRNQDAQVVALTGCDASTVLQE